MKTTMSSFAFAALATLSAAALAQDAPPAASAHGTIENAIRSQLRDPDSAKFSWPYGFTSGWYRKPFGKKAVGQITCGTLNAKNGYGGYTGAKTVIVVVGDDGHVIDFDIDDNETFGSNHGQPTEVCKKLGMAF